MKFCSSCGSATLVRHVPEGDTHPRMVCEACGDIHYVNPKIIVGTLPLFEGNILLCRRAIEPRLGTWTLPAGFMELAETVEEGAARETLEEAGVRVDIERLFSVVSVPVVNQVYMLFLARIQEPEFNFGPETSEVRLVSEAEIPWDELSFLSIEYCLRKWVESPDGGKNGVHLGVVERNP